jgi:Tol biopolymer transport system component
MGAATPIQLTESAKDCLYPFWSPDGTRLYYISEQALWSVNASGGPSEKVLDNVAQASIAPDGRTFAALRREGKTYAIWTGSLPQP